MELYHLLLDLKDKAWGKVKTFVVPLALFGIIGIISLSYSQTSPPEGNLPSYILDIPDNIREEIQGLYSPDPGERAHFAFLLGEMGSEAIPAIPFLIAMLDDSTTLYHPPYEPTSPGDEAAAALVRIGEPAVGSLLSATNHDNSVLRTSALRILAHIKGPHTLPSLVPALRDENSSVRLAAASALASVKDPNAVEALMAAIRDDSFLVRQQAAEALGEIKDPASLVALLTALRVDDWHVRHYASQAIALINGRDAVESLIAALKDPNWHLRYWAAETFVSMSYYSDLKDSYVVESLIVALKDDDPNVRVAAGRALASIADPYAVNPLVLALNDTYWAVRNTAAVALGLTKDPRAIGPLISMLRDDDWTVRYSAEWALRYITGEDFGTDPDKWEDWQMQDADIAVNDE